jgi:hypothetical protein
MTTSDPKDPASTGAAQILELSRCACGAQSGLGATAFGTAYVQCRNCGVAAHGTGRDIGAAVQRWTELQDALRSAGWHGFKGIQ